MSDDAPTQPKKMTVEDLVIAQQRTQAALEKIAERLDLIVDREMYTEDYASGNLMLFRAVTMPAMLISWVASAYFAATPVLIFISFLLYAFVDTFFEISSFSAREQDKRRRVREYWKQRDAEAKAADWEAWKDIGRQFRRFFRF